MLSAEYEIREIVAAAGMAPAACYTFVPYQGLQEPQSFQRQTYCGFGHVQTHPGNPPKRRKCPAFPTGTAVQIQQCGESSRGQVIGQNVPADQGVAALPAEPEVAVGGVN